MTPRAIVLGAAILTAACTQAIDVHTVQSPAAHFEGYRTFTYETEIAAPPGFSAPPPSTHVEQDAQRFASEMLRSKGYVFVPGGPADLRIRLSVGRRRGERQEPQHVSPAWLTENEDEEQDFVEGALVIDAFDSAGELLWHGAARTEIDPGHVDERLLRRAVSQVLSSLPGK